MPLWIRYIWIFSIIVNILSLVWYILESTTYFQRGLDLLSTVILIFMGIPSSLLSLGSILLLKKGWVPNGKMSYTVLLIVILILFLYSISFLF